MTAPGTRIIERIEPRPLRSGHDPVVDVTARDVRHDGVLLPPYTFTVHGAEAVRAIYDEAKTQ